MILKKKHLKNFDLMFFQSKHTCKSTHTTLPNTHTVQSSYDCTLYL
jgi:hypothetical protein